MAEADLAGQAPALHPLAPVGVQVPAEQLIGLVEQLRTRLAGKPEVAESPTLWGADILDASDPRSTHILAKCGDPGPKEELRSCLAIS